MRVPCVLLCARAVYWHGSAPQRRDSAPPSCNWPLSRAACMGFNCDNCALKSPPHTTGSLGHSAISDSTASHKAL
eukprot:5406727-Alexandrium_andersonii.AAC.1